MLKDTDEIGKLTRHLDILNREIETSNRLISDLLDYSSIQEPHIELTDIPLLIGKVLSEVEPPAGIDVRSAFVEEIPMIRVDRGQISVAVKNLLTNAILAMPLFTTRAKGIGLGLAIVEKYVRNHRGDIDVKSEIGKGTTFFLRLPVTGNP